MHAMHLNKGYQYPSSTQHQEGLVAGIGTSFNNTQESVLVQQFQVEYQSTIDISEYYLSESLFNELSIESQDIITQTEREQQEEEVDGMMKVLNWRLDNQINEQEFSILYRQWLSSKHFDLNHNLFSYHYCHSMHLNKFLLKIKTCTDIRYGHKELVLYYLEFLNAELNQNLLKGEGKIHVDQMNTLQIVFLNVEEINLIEEIYMLFDDEGIGFISEEKFIYFFIALNYEILEQYYIEDYEPNFQKLLNEFQVNEGQISLRSFQLSLIQKYYGDDLLKNLEIFQKNCLSVFQENRLVSEDGQETFLDIFQDSYLASLASEFDIDFKNIYSINNQCFRLLLIFLKENLYQILKLVTQKASNLGNKQCLNEEDFRVPQILYNLFLKSYLEFTDGIEVSLEFFQNFWGNYGKLKGKILSKYLKKSYDQQQQRDDHKNNQNDNIQCDNFQIFIQSRPTGSQNSQHDTNSISSYESLGSQSSQQSGDFKQNPTLKGFTEKNLNILRIDENQKPQTEQRNLINILYDFDNEKNFSSTRTIYSSNSNQNLLQGRSMFPQNIQQKKMIQEVNEVQINHQELILKKQPVIQQNTDEISRNQINENFNCREKENLIPAFKAKKDLCPTNYPNLVETNNIKTQKRVIKNISVVRAQPTAEEPQQRNYITQQRNFKAFDGIKSQVRIDHQKSQTKKEKEHTQCVEPENYSNQPVQIKSYTNLNRQPSPFENKPYFDYNNINNTINQKLTRSFSVKTSDQILNNNQNHLNQTPQRNTKSPLSIKQSNQPSSIHRRVEKFETVMERLSNSTNNPLVEKNLQTVKTRMFNLQLYP